MAEKHQGFAVMRWLNDGNRLSVHNLKHVVQPKIPSDFKIGMRGLSLYPGYPGKWEFRILKLGGKKELEEWLSENLPSLANDVSDNFCSETETVKADGCDEEEKMPRCSPQKIRRCEGTPNKQIIATTNLRRSPRMRENDVESDIQYFKRDKEKKDVYKDKIDKLEDDLRSLRRRNRKLEERVEKLERNSSVTVSPPVSRPVSPPVSRPVSPPVSRPVSPPVSRPPVSRPVSPPVRHHPTSYDEQHSDSVLTEEALLKGLETKRIVGDSNILKYLCFEVFTKDEIVNCTRTGKRTIKNMDNVKPSFDPVKFGLLERVVMQATSFDKTSFHKKLENYQKVLRRSSSD